MNAIVETPIILRIAIAIAVSVILQTASASVETVDYAYDETGRLIGVAYDTGATITYLYDANGNLLRRTVSTFVDSNGNGIDDNWEMAHFGVLDVDPNAPSASPGMTLLQEYLAGTDPNDPDDFLRVREITRAAVGEFVIEWAAVPGKLYRVQYTETLRPHDWHNLPGEVLAEGSTATKTDFTAPAAAKRFYRVVVLQ